jgi:hypothetical protein
MTEIDLDEEWKLKIIKDETHISLTLINSHGMYCESICLDISEASEMINELNKLIR